MTSPIELPANPRISAIVISKQEGENLRLTIAELQRTLPRDSQLIVVDDGSTDGSADFLDDPAAPAELIRANGLGVAGARNLGVAGATGDVLIFVDAHMTLPQDWWLPLVELLRNGRVAAAAPCVSDVTQTHRKGFGLRLTGPQLNSSWLSRTSNDPHPVPILPGCALAIRREIFHAAGGFDSGMIRSQGIDNEFCMRLWLLGYECWIDPRVEVVHLFRNAHPYEIDWTGVLHNRLRLALVHLDRRRIQSVVEAMRTRDEFPAAVALCADSDALSRRVQLASQRKYDPDWFFEHHGPNW